MNPYLRRLGFCIPALIFLWVVLIPTSPVSAASTCAGFIPPTITTPANLVTAVQQAQSANCPGADTIDLAGATITFTTSFATYIGAETALPQITTPITIMNGTIERSLAGGTPNFRLLSIAAAGSLTLNNLTLSNGNADAANGGAVYNQGSLTINQSTLNNHSAASGGAVYNATATTTTVTRSTFINNSASTLGLAIATVGGAGTSITLANSTVTQNTGTGTAYGAIMTTTNVTTTLFNVTISNNTAGATTQTGGLASFGPLFLYNSILANNTPSDCEATTAETFSPGLSNIIEVNGLNPCGTTGITHRAIDPQLGALTGSPAYYPLLVTSPAVNAGDNASIGGATVDQPGNTRIQGTVVDLGSYESPFPLVTVQFNAATSSANEADGFGNLLRVTTSDGSPTAAATTVIVNVTGGTATAADYNRTGTITIPAATLNGALVSIASGITVTNETLVESNETLVLTLSAPVGAVLGPQTTTTHTILNDDTAAVTVGDVTQVEGNAGTSTMTFTVTLNNAVQGGFTLNYTTTDLSATTADNDYVAAAGTLTFAGTAGESQTIGVTINGDTKVEPNETFMLSFPMAIAVAAPGSLSIIDTATGTITNDDTAALTIADVAQLEGNAGTSTMTFTVTLNNAVADGFTATYVTANGTATVADADYVSVAGALTFAGTAGETQTFMVTINGDTALEADETFTVSFITISKSGVDITDTATGTITNDDTASLTIADEVVTEGNAGTTNMIFTVTLDNEVQDDFTVNYATADGTATAADNDYVPTTGQLSFTGAAGQTRTFVVLINGDTTVEPNETFTVSLNTISNPALDIDITDTATGTINDNDTNGAVTIANVTQPENGTFTFTATLSHATSSSFSVDWMLVPGTTNAADYVGGVLPAGGTLTFAGIAGETQTFTVPVLDDAVVEPTETFTVGMTDFTTLGGFTINVTDTATGTITDNDVAAGYMVDTALTTNIAEPATATTFTIRLVGLPSGTVVLDFGSTDLTECTVSPANVTFNAGNWNTPQTITITAADDLIADGTQPCAATITRTGGTAAEYTAVANPANVTLNVADDETASITVNPTTIAISESGGTTTFAVNANTTPSGAVTIPITTDGQCEVDTGGGFSIATTLTLPAGSIAPQTVTVRAVNDVTIEGAHTCAITTDNPASAADAAYDALGAGDVADVTAAVTDNDVLHTLAAGAGGAEGTGANPTYTFTITRTGATTVASSVDYTLGGTGVSGTDYVALNPATDITGVGVSATATTITFAANATTATITVTVNADGISEPDFTLDVTLTTPVADGGAGTGTIAGSPASLTVTDDDVAGYIVDTAATAATITEAVGTTTFTVRLVSQPGGTVVLDFGSTDTTECSVTPATFTFNAGNWNTPQTITFTGVDDLIADGDQPCAATITRNASSTAAEYAAVADPANVNVAVTDDETPGITVTAPLVTSLNELGGTPSTTFTIVLNTQPTGDVTIPLSSSDTTECTVNPASLTFTAANWNIAPVVTITAVDDVITDGDQPCTAEIGVTTSSDPSYAALDPADITVTVIDNDVPGLTFGAATITEGAGAQTYTVQLNTQPLADVEITAITPDAQCTISGVTLPLTFTTADWNIPQTITVTAVDDPAIEGNHSCVVNHTVTSTDAAYALGTVNRTLPVVDNDTATPPTNSDNGGGEPAIGVFDPALSKIGILMSGDLGILGERLSWQVTVTNTGTATGTGVVFTDTLRPELRIEDVQTSKGTISVNGQTVTVNIGNVAVGETINITILTTVLQSDIVVNNSACVRSDMTGEECVTSANLRAAQISELPASGETPWWASWVRVGLVLAVGGVLVLAVRRRYFAG